MAGEFSYLINLPADTGSATKQANTTANSFLVIAILIIVEFNWCVNRFHFDLRLKWTL
jgi:hypothetical protein